MNIIISGWPGAGTTSLALLMSHLLEYRYVYGGGVFKYLGQQIAGDTSGPKFIEFEQKFGVAWDQIWEPYVMWKLEHSDKMIVEGKTTGFFAESENYYEIMLIAKVSARASRAAGDGRTDAEQTIMARDVVVRQRWINEYGIDVYDPQLIVNNYDLLVDNSQMTIDDELQFVLSNLEEDYRFPRTDLEQEKKHAQEAVTMLQSKGKDFVRESLHERGLLVNPQEVMKEWNEHFADRVQALPDELKNIVLTMK